MSTIYNIAVNRCTFLLAVAALLTVAAPLLARRESGQQAGICCFVVGWHLAIMDAVLWVLSTFEMMGPQFHARDAHMTLFYAPLSLVVPLLVLTCTVLSGFRSPFSLNRGNRLLIATSCVALLDIVLIILATAKNAQEHDGWITPGYRESLQQQSEQE